MTLIFVIIFNFFLFRVMGDPTTQLARLPNSSPEEVEKLRADYGHRQADHRPVRGLRGRHADPRLRDLAAHRAGGLGRDARCASLDAAPGRDRHPARDAVRRLAGGVRRDAARQEGRHALAQLQPVHLLGARVLDRDPPDPRLRRLDTGLTGRAAGDAGDRVLELVRRGARRRRAPDPARDRDDPDAPGAVLPDHALVDGRRPHRGLRHRQARDGPALAPRGPQATRCRTRCCRS